MYDETSVTDIGISDESSCWPSEASSDKLHGIPDVALASAFRNEASKSRAGEVIVDGMDSLCFRDSLACK
jgi:hypothetical protein